MIVGISSGEFRFRVRYAAHRRTGIRYIVQRDFAPRGPPMIQVTLKDYYALHGEPPPGDELLRDNAIEWVRRANLLLAEADKDGVRPGIDQISHNSIASGYRPPGVNSATSNAAASSTHLICMGGDVQDTLDGKRQLAVWCCRHQDVMARIGLWMEDPRWCAGTGSRDPWCHWQWKAPGSGKRIYLPYHDVVAHPAQDPDFFSRNGLPLPA